MNLVPEAVQLSRVMSQVTAPAFVLGAVAGFVNVSLGRMTSVVERIRSLNGIPDNDSSRVHLKSDIPRLQKRISLLISATRLALASGVCTAMLIIVGFLFAFVGLQYIWGAAVLFLSALALLGVALSRLSQEVGMGLSEADHYR
jgi:hypothetical protein